MTEAERLRDIINTIVFWIADDGYIHVPLDKEKIMQAVADSKIKERTMTNDTPETGQWAILELMGRKIVAGYLTKDDWQGHAMLRIDVPATPAFPAFTQVYGPQAVYCITYVSEEVAHLTAEHNRVNPVSVYVPDLQDTQRVRQENQALRETVKEMQSRLRMLPSPGGPDTDPTQIEGEDDESFERDETDDDEGDDEEGF